MHCNNCGHIVENNYCSHCGQSALVGRITIKRLLSQLNDSIFQLDRGFFFTFFALFRSPGASIRAYLDGKRVSYYKPITYVLILSTIYFVSTNFLGMNTWLGDIISGFQRGMTDDGESTEGIVPSIMNWFAGNFAYTTLLLLPIFSFSSFLAFKSKGYNYAEHLVLNAYITGQKAILYVLTAIILAIVDKYWLEPLGLGLSMLYTFIVYWQFFNDGNRAANLLRSIITYLLFFIFTAILIASLGIGIHQLTTG